MQCATIKSGVECSFMNKAGCGYLGGACRAIEEKCVGCERVKEFNDGKYCSVFPDPAAKWRLGNCNMATHVKVESKEGGKTRVGQQKQKKK